MKSSEARSSWVPLIAVSLTLFIVVLDTSMMNVAISTIVDELDTSVSALQTGISMYSLVMAAFMIAGAKFGDLYGTRRVFVVALVVYGIGTTMAALAPSIGVLILGWSVIEGLAAAAMIPVCLGLVMVNYSGRQRVLAFAMMSGVQASAAAIGPVFGGVMTSYLSWRAGFAFEVLIVIVVLALLRWLKGSPPKRDQTIDWVGIALSAAGFAALVWGVLQAGQYGWWDARRPYSLAGFSFNPFGLSPTPWFIAAGLVLLTGFAHWVGRRQHLGRTPLVRLSLFSHPAFTFGFITDSLNSLMLAGILFITPLFLQQALGFDAISSGLAVLPASLAVMAVSLSAAKLGTRLRPKTIIQAGLVLVAVSLLLYRSVISADLTSAQMIGPLLLFGAGIGLLLSQISNVTLSALPAGDTNEGSGVQNSFKELGSSLGTAIIGSLLISSVTLGVVDRFGDETSISLSAEQRERYAIEFEDAANRLKDPDELKHFVTDGLPAGVADQYEEILTDASVDGMRNTILQVEWFVLAALLASTFLQRPRARKIKQPPGFTHPELGMIS